MYNVFDFLSECRFSDKRYELEDTWHPDLGPPFGVMYCVHCECVAVRKFKLSFKQLLAKFDYLIMNISVIRHSSVENIYDSINVIRHLRI